MLYNLYILLSVMADPKIVGFLAYLKNRTAGPFS